MQSVCAAVSCSSGKSEPLFRFPRQPERSKKWVEKCQREDLMDKSPEELYRYYRLCGKHFETSLIDSETQATTLKEDAIPTIFDVPSQASNGQGKRSKEMPRDSELTTGGRKKARKSPEGEEMEEVKEPSKEDEYKEYLKSLFEVLLLLGEQNIALTGTSSDGRAESLESSTFQALLEYRMNCGDKILKRRHEENGECCSSAQLQQLIEVCEKSIRTKLLEEVKKNGLFSLLTDDPVKISREWLLPIFLRSVDQSNCQQESFVGFLNFEGDPDELGEKLLTELTEEWGLDMEMCRGQAHSCSGTHLSKIKAFSAKVMEKHPAAFVAVRSTRPLNASLAAGMPFPGVQLAISTLKKIQSFFSQSPSLQLEFEDAISIFYPENEEKAGQLKEICRTDLAGRHDSFELALEILEPLLLCVDSVHDNEDMRWTDQIAHDALEISKAVADYEFIITLVVLKNVLTLTQALGTNLQGSATDLHFAAGSVKVVVRYLQEVHDNIDVYHEFWNNEAVNMATAMDVPVKVPGSYLRKHQLEAKSVRASSYYKQHLSLPLVSHVLSQLGELFCENHLKTLQGAGLVPGVIEQLKSSQPDEASVQVFSGDIPNAGTLSAELDCWWIKWGKKGKNEKFPCSIQQTLQAADVKFFPNMLAILRLMAVLPTVTLQEDRDVAFKRFKIYTEKTPEKLKSQRLALLNMNYDVGLDLDSMAEMFMKTYPKNKEEPADVDSTQHL